jgi:hypothetical protein
MINSFGPGNQKKPPKPPNSEGVKKNINPVATNTPVGGTPAANPMGGAQMDFDMPDMSGMGGMQMSAPSPTGGDNYENFMMGMTAINGEQPSGANVIKSPEGHMTAGGWRNELPGVAGMNSMGAQPTGMAGFAGAQSPQVAGWNDPAMGGFQMDTPMMNDPMMGQPDMGGMQMGQPDMGQPFMGNPVMGFQGQQPPAGQQPPGNQQPPQGDAPDGWQGEFPANPIPGPFYDKKDEYYKMMMAATAPMNNRAWKGTNEGWDIARKLAKKANEKTDKDAKKKPSGRRPTLPGRGNRSSFAGGDAQAGSSVAPPISAAPAVEPAVTSSDDISEPSVSAGTVSEGAMENGKNWDTVDGEYKFMGADYHKQNTRPKADTKDWEKTRKAAAKNIKEGGDKFSEVGDAAYGTASSESRSAANEADLGIPDVTTGMGIDESAIGIPSAPIVNLPPIQPQTDKDYYDKLVNPDPFQNPIIPDLPAGYGSQRVEGGGEYHEFPGREYDVKPEEIFDEYGEPLMGSQGIDSNAGGMTIADVRRRGTTPAQVQALVNNEVANTYQQANQGLGAMTGARPGMSGDIGSYAQQSLGPEVAARMAAGQAQVDIPWQYAMQHADQVRQRRDLAHKLGLEEAGMITGDYYDYLGDKMGYADTDNQIMRQMYGEMPDAFG